MSSLFLIVSDSYTELLFILFNPKKKEESVFLNEFCFTIGTLVYFIGLKEV